MHLHHVRNGLPGCEDDVHAVVPLGTAIADISGVVVSGKSPFFKDADPGLLCELMEMNAARMRIAVNVLDQNLGLFNVGVVPAASHLKRIELSPPQTLFCTFLLHENLLKNISSKLCEK